MEKKQGLPYNFQGENSWVLGSHVCTTRYIEMFNPHPRLTVHALKIWTHPSDYPNMLAGRQTVQNLIEQLQSILILVYIVYSNKSIWIFTINTEEYYRATPCGNVSSGICGQRRPISANSPVSILHKSIAGRYRPVSYPDGPITVRYRFIKNASWENHGIL